MSRKSSLLLRLAASTAIAGLVLSACAQKENSGGGGNSQRPAGYPEVYDEHVSQGKPGGTFKLGIVEPTAIDPYNAQESEGLLVTRYLYTGLTKATPDGKVEPALATSWDTNDDCSQWTFHLKTGTKFHDGEPVTAQSFVDGWDREARKAAASEVSYHMDQIKGYSDVNTGKANHMAGVSAPDPATLKVELSEPSCEFYIRTSHTVFSPMPKKAPPAGNQAFADKPIGNGPFMMDGPWQHDKGIKLKRFDGYTAGPKAYLDEVEITILAGDETAQQKEVDGLKNGQFDWARIPPDDLKEMRAEYEPKHAWISRKTFGIDYLVVKNDTPPLNSVDARKAISMAIDRNAIINGVFDGSKAPATAFIPAGFKDSYQPGVCTACKFDPKEAKKLADKAGLKPGTTVNFQFNTGGGHEQWTAAVKQQLEKNLGLKINYSGVEFSDMLDNMAAPHASGLYRLSWGADYPTPGNFLQPIFSTSGIGTTDPNKPVLGDNNARYSNPEFDKLIEQAAATKDEKERANTYKKAEKIAIGDDLADIPMFERQQFRAVDNQEFGNVGFMDFQENPPLDVIYKK